MRWPVDAKIGNAQDRAQGRARLAQAVEQRHCVYLADHTVVKVVSQGSLKLYGVPFWSGESKHRLGQLSRDVWVEKRKCHRYTIQQVYQSMRAAM